MARGFEEKYIFWRFAHYIIIEKVLRILAPRTAVSNINCQQSAKLLRWLRCFRNANQPEFLGKVSRFQSRVSNVLDPRLTFQCIHNLRGFSFSEFFRKCSTWRPRPQPLLGSRPPWRKGRGKTKIPMTSSFKISWSLLLLLFAKFNEN